jgi:hypothetical protein
MKSSCSLVSYVSQTETWCYRGRNNGIDNVNFVTFRFQAVCILIDDSQATYGAVPCCWQYKRYFQFFGPAMTRILGIRELETVI